MAMESPSNRGPVLDARELFTCSRDGLFVLDAQGHFLDANPAALELAGCSLDRLQEMALADLLVSYSMPRTVLSSDQREVRLRRTDGRVLFVECRGMSISYAGQPAFLWMVRDITQHRQVEEALYARIVQLEDRPQDRPADLSFTPRRLWLPQQVNSGLIADVSHELRTPIATFKLYLALLRKAPPEKQAEYLDALEKEVNRQAQLVEDILHISRLDSGRFELKYRKVSINDLVRATANRYRGEAHERGLSVECRLDEGMKEIVADAEQMLDALERLIANAFQYTPPGGRVVLSTARERAGWTVIRVTDTGTGIREDELPHIFERFFRGKEALKRNVPGTGLGLAIAKEITELHGGYVTAHSQPGTGTTLAVWLPDGSVQGQVAIPRGDEERGIVHDK